MEILNNIFHSQKPIVGMIHLPALIGYKEYQGIDVIKKRIIDETHMLNRSGVHAIMVENNYDIPHKEIVDKEVGEMMMTLTQAIIENTKLPVGINVLWNDFQSAFTIAAATGAQFIRIPAFVDDVSTIYGDMPAVADKAIMYRKKLNLENKVAILADVQVKHSRMIDKSKKLSVSVQQAIEARADGIIITGKMTGDAPLLEHLQIAKQNNKSTPVFIGSGSTIENLSTLLKLSDGIIVGTAIMTAGVVNSLKLKNYMDTYQKIQEKYVS